MIDVTRRSHSGARIDDRTGGRYLAIPLGVQKTGCGTLTAYAARDWRANFFPVGIAHSIVGGSAWERTPWRATRRAAGDALNDTRQTA
jgi:hypothetical protein